MSDTPRTDKATCYITDVFGTQFETTNPAIARQLERELADVTAERDSMVARFRDEIKQRQETQRANAIVDAQKLATVTAERDELKADLCVFAVDMERQLSASQQEARRLREALQRAMDGVEWAVRRGTTI